MQKYYISFIWVTKTFLKQYIIVTFKHRHILVLVLTFQVSYSYHKKLCVFCLFLTWSVRQKKNINNNNNKIHENFPVQYLTVWYVFVCTILKPTSKELTILQKEWSFDYAYVHGTKNEKNQYNDHCPAVLQYFTYIHTHFIPIKTAKAIHALQLLLRQVTLNE
jgi:hypothetical protein